MMKFIAFIVLFFAQIATTAQAAEKMQLGPAAAAAPVKGQNQFCPDAAYGKGGYLVVWQRSRNETGRVECARIDPAGKPVDAQPVVLAPDMEWQENPRVAFGGGNYLVVWQDLRNGKDFDIYAARVTPEGKVLDPGGFPICTTTGTSQVYPSVTHDGKSFIVVWSEAQSQIEDGKYWPLAITRVSAEGKVSTPVRIEAKLSRGRLTDVKESDMVVAQDRLFLASGGPCFARVLSLKDFKPIKEGTTDEDQVDTNRIESGTRRASVATDGSRFVAFYWTGSRKTTEGDSKFISMDGQAGGSVEPFWGGREDGIMQPAVAFDGKNYILAWQPYSDGKQLNARLLTLRFNSEGKPVDQDEKIAADGANKQLNVLPRLASDGKGHVLMVWQQHPTSAEGNVVAATRLIATETK